MSITDELRAWIRARNMMAKETFDQLHAIADRIDEQAEKESEAAWRRGYERGEDEAKFESLDELRKEVQADWILLPVDADGKVIHVEDEVELLDGSKRFKAEWLEWDGEDWVVHETIGYGAYHEPSSLRHSRKPTVEDVLREFAERICSGDHAVINGTYRGLEDLDLLAKYAAKLRLAGEDE